MADKNLMDTLNMSGEADVSLILDSLMYTDTYGDVLGGDYGRDYYNNHTVKEIVYDILERTDVSDGQKKVAENIKNYIETPKGSQVGDLVMLSHSEQLDSDYQGAHGAVFYNRDSSGKVQDVYVAFRGTGDGRWVDNGIAFGTEYSDYQQDAAQYFDKAMEELGVDESCNVVTTGHSKGGNFSQYVALGSKNAYLVDKVISFDGQGFSPEAISYFKKLYGEEFYEQQLQKMYSVCGDDDPVNELGIRIIPEDHRTFVVSQKDGALSDYADNIAGVHAIEYLYNYSDGSFNPTTDKQRELAKFAKLLNEYIMTLPLDERDAVCRAVMSYIEFGEKYTTGYNGETATMDEHLELLAHIDDVVEFLVFTKQGQEFINSAEYDWIKKLLSNGENTSPEGNILLSITAAFVQYRISGAVSVAEGFVVILSEAISLGAEMVKEFKQAYEFCCDLLKSLDTLRKWIFDGDYRAAQAYLEENEWIQFDTGELHKLAEKLWSLNGRLEKLDHRLDDVYKHFKWRDLGKIIKVASADLKIGWSSRINDCANCLNDTANRFENVESQILGLLGQ